MGKAAKRKILQKMRTNPLAFMKEKIKPNPDLLFIPKVLQMMESVAQMPETVYSFCPSGVLMFDEIILSSVSKAKVAKNDFEKEMWLSFPNKCVENAIGLHLLHLAYEKSTDDHSVIPEKHLKHGYQIAKWSVENNQWVPPNRNWIQEYLDSELSEKISV